jgi:hypothetical protein
MQHNEQDDNRPNGAIIWLVLGALTTLALLLGGLLAAGAERMLGA